MKFYIRVFSTVLALILAVSLAGCTGKPEETESVEINLGEFENMEQLESYMAQDPEAEYLYQVVIGDQTYSRDTREMTLQPGDQVFDSLLRNLQFLPSVTEVHLENTDLTADQLNQLRSTYPNVDFSYTLSLAGKLYPERTQWADFSYITSQDVQEVISKLPLLPNLERVILTPASGENNLALTDVSALQDAAPEVFFDYSFELFGQLLSTADETVAYDEVPIGNEGEEQIRQALDILDNCTYFKLDDCGIDNEIMASIREDYPDTKVVWRVHIKPFSMLTDETMLRLTFYLNDSNVHDLKYLNDVTYLDVGHNEPLTDISFVQYMPKLECVIISGSSVVDVSYFKHCPNLIWLELCFCYNIQDISCLEDHPTLKYLNISFTRVSDLSPLENVKLERLNAMQNHVNYEERLAFTESHPDCLSVWEGSQPYGYGWRYNDRGYTFFEYYANMRIVFRYDDTDYFGNHKEK